jgi:hypothetical protein
MSGVAEGALYSWQDSADSISVSCGTPFTELKSFSRFEFFKGGLSAIFLGQKKKPKLCHS